LFCWEVLRRGKVVIFERYQIVMTSIRQGIKVGTLLVFLE
jgi:hypothetical protein